MTPSAVMNIPAMIFLVVNAFLRLEVSDWRLVVG